MALHLIVACLAVAALGLSSPAGATTITLSQLSSEPSTNPAGDLDATFQFDIVDLGSGLNTLLLTVTNDTVGTAGVDAYNMNEIYFNSLGSVTSLSLTSATHSNAPNVTNNWPLFASTGDGSPTHADGFGIFDWALLDGKGMTNPSLIGPGENIVFQLEINSNSGTFTMADFVDLSAQPTGGGNTVSLVAAKFVNGPDGCSPGGCDSGFGSTQTTAPEPSSLSLLALGIAAIATFRRRFRVVA